MGWFKDAIEWITDKILRPVINWIAKLIDDIVKGFRKARMQFTYALADWLQDDTFFFCAFVAVIVGAFLLPHIAEWFAGLVKKFLATALVKAIKLGLAKLIDIKKIIDLKFLSDMLKIFFPEYKKACMALNNALSSFAKELGEDTAFIHSYLAMARGVTAGTCALLGLPAESMEISWYEKASEWSGKLRSRINRYVEYPEMIFNDIIDEVLLPLQEDYVLAQQDQLDSLRANIDRVREIEGGIKLLESSVSTFISEMPEEIEKVMLEKIGPGLEDIREAIATLDVEVLDKVDAVYVLLREHENRIARMNEIVKAKRWDIRSQFSESLLWPKAERWEFHMDVADIVLSGLDKTVETQVEAAFALADLQAENFAKAIAALKAIPSLSYEPVALSLPAPTAEAVALDWFVGEY